VRCVDCHEAHSLEMVRPAAQLCTHCHLAEKYAVPEHHFHEAGTPGAECVDCHMPVRKYMVVDPRRDHSFRVPRPDLSVALGTPNACNDCHEDESAQWAADACLEWYGPPSEDPPSAAPAIHAAVTGRAGADAMLIDVAQNDAHAAIVRATAVELLRDQPSEASLDVIREQARADDPLLRMAAMRALSPYPPELRWSIGAAALDDDVRLVRVEAARVLAAESGTHAQGDRVEAFGLALKELRTSLEINADRPSTLVDRGNLERDLGRFEAAQEAYGAALRLQPNDVAASVNLADLYREIGREDQVMQVLQDALRVSPNEAALHYAIGLSHVRGGDIGNAIMFIQRACELAPTVARYSLVYATALNRVGRGDDALSVLAQALQQSPGNRDLLYAMATIARDQGRLDVAVAAAQRLVQLAPSDPQYRALLESLR